MEIKSKTLLIAFFFLIVISIWITYQRTLVNKDFEIINTPAEIEEENLE